MNMESLPSSLFEQSKPKVVDPLINRASKVLNDRGYNWQIGIAALSPADRAVCNAINPPLEALSKLMALERKAVADLAFVRSEIAEARAELEATIAMVSYG